MNIEWRDCRKDLPDKNQMVCVALASIGPGDKVYTQVTCGWLTFTKAGHPVWSVLTKCGEMSRLTDPGFVPPVYAWHSLLPPPEVSK